MVRKFGLWILQAANVLTYRTQTPTLENLRLNAFHAIAGLQFQHPIAAHLCCLGYHLLAPATLENAEPGARSGKTILFTGGGDCPDQYDADFFRQAGFEHPLLIDISPQFQDGDAADRRIRAVATHIRKRFGLLVSVAHTDHKGEDLGFLAWLGVNLREDLGRPNIQTTHQLREDSLHLVTHKALCMLSVGMEVLRQDAPTRREIDGHHVYCVGPEGGGR